MAFVVQAYVWQKFIDHRALKTFYLSDSLPTAFFSVGNDPLFFWKACSDLKIVCSPCKRYWVAGTIALTVLLHFGKSFHCWQEKNWAESIQAFGISTWKTLLIISARLMLIGKQELSSTCEYIWFPHNLQLHRYSFRFVKKKFVLLKDLSVRVWRLAKSLKFSEWQCLDDRGGPVWNYNNCVGCPHRGGALSFASQKSVGLWGNQQSDQQIDRLCDKSMYPYLVSFPLEYGLFKWILNDSRAVAIVETVAFSVMPNTFYSFAIDFIIGKCESFRWKRKTQSEFCCSVCKFVVGCAQRSSKLAWLGKGTFHINRDVHKIQSRFRSWE